MTVTNYMKWSEQKLIPNLSPNSVILTENAPYHCMHSEKCPIASSQKVEMIQWLLVNCVCVPRHAITTTVCSLAKKSVLLGRQSSFSIRHIELTTLSSRPKSNQDDLGTG